MGLIKAFTNSAMSYILLPTKYAYSVKGSAFGVTAI